MRLATFNLESLDLPPKAAVGLEARAAVLRPAIERLNADVVCLQEVNGQRVAGVAERQLVALDQLLQGTRYEGFQRVATKGPGGAGVADVHNLVVLSRFPVLGSREVRQDLVPALMHRMQTALPPVAGPAPVLLDRPLLMVDLDVGGGRVLTVVNVHFRSPLAVGVPGQKLSSFVWRSVGGWAEGFFLSSVKRGAQALELRLLLDQVLDADPARLIVVAGDFNAEDHEVPVRLVAAAEEDTGNGALTARSLVILDRSVPADRRWSVLHHGRPQMLDHILISHALLGAFRGIEVHNEALGDEAVAYGRIDNPPGSYHAAVVAEFAR